MKTFPHANAFEKLTWAADSSSSSAADLTNDTPRGVGVLVTNITDWVTAVVGFDVSIDGETFYPLRKADGTRVTVVVGNGGYPVSEGEAWGVTPFNYLRLVALDADDKETPVTQTAATLTFEVVKLV